MAVGINSIVRLFADDKIAYIAVKSEATNLSCMKISTNQQYGSKSGKRCFTQRNATYLPSAKKSNDKT